MQIFNPVNIYRRNKHRYCEIARELTLRDEWKVGRVIARPYVGRKKDEFLKYLKDDDLLLITADHGNDPAHG